MPHKESIRIVPGAATAVLFLHGICGSPNHFRQLLALEAAVPQDWSFHNLCLDGHCGTVKAFGKSSMKTWQTQVETAFDSLCQKHEKVVLVGHSMGTLFSIRIALRHPEKVAFLFLLASPVRVFVKPRAVKYLLKIAFDFEDETDPVLVSMRNACGIQQTKRLWNYIPWMPRMVELLRLCAKTAKSVSRLRVPCIALQSDHDEMVSRRADRLLENSGRVEVIHLKNSTHFYYSPEDAEVILARFRRACAARMEEIPPSAKT